MRDSIDEVTQALSILGKPSPWSPDVKATDEFLDPLFKSFFHKLEMPLEFRKADYHKLASLVPKNKIDQEIVQKLDAIVNVASKAKRRTE